MLQRLDGQWAAVQIALEGGAAQVRQAALVRWGLDPFGDHPESELVRQGDDGGGDGGIVAVVQNVAHEALVDLQFVQRQALQVGQGRVAGTKVVERKTHAMVFQREHLEDGGVDVRHQHALGQFQLEPLGAMRVTRQGLQHLLHEVFLVQLACADVDGHAQLGTARVRGPAPDLGTGAVQHPVAQRQNRPRFFGQRYEIPGRHQPAFRVLPAHQRLHAGDLTECIHLRLEMQHKLLLAQGITQIAVQGRAGKYLGLHPRVEKAQLVAPRRLGLVHGQVGALHQVFDAAVRHIQQGDTNAGGTAVVLPIKHIGLPQRDENFFRHRLGLSGRGQRVVAQILQHDDELVAP